MAANNVSVDLRDYVRVIFARGWWILFIALGVMAAVFYYSFYVAPRTYTAENEILVTDKFSGALAKDMGGASDWTTRTKRAELDLRRSAPAREIIASAAAAVDIRLSEPEVADMAEKFDDNNVLNVTHSKEGRFIRLSYTAKDGRLAAAVLSLFMKRMIESCVAMQVGDLNNEVATLTALKARLSADVAVAERKLDEMKTIAPEMRLTASTMALLKSGQEITTTPSTEQAVSVLLELERDIINIDGDIADRKEQIALITRQMADEPKSIPSQRKLEAIPAVQNALKKRDELRIQLAQLMSNSTASHPLVKSIQTELKSLDAFLSTAAATANVETVFEPNPEQARLKARLEQFQSDLGGLIERRARMAENAAKWREKLDTMPAEFRFVREATLDYDNKAKNLQQITNQLVQAQIKRNLQLDQVGTYYRPQADRTAIPTTYKNRHLIRLLLGLVLGLAAGVFAVYAMEFADHSVKDQRDMASYTKAAVLGVISDYNQYKAVASRAAWTRAAGVKQYLLAALFVALVALLSWATYHNWPREETRAKLPADLSVAGVATIEQAMKMYSAPISDLDVYTGAEQPEVNVTPAVEVPAEQAPQPAMSE